MRERARKRTLRRLLQAKAAQERALVPVVHRGCPQDVQKLLSSWDVDRCCGTERAERFNCEVRFEQFYLGFATVLAGFYFHQTWKLRKRRFSLACETFCDTFCDRPCVHKLRWPHRSFDVPTTHPFLTGCRLRWDRYFSAHGRSLPAHVWNALIDEVLLEEVGGVPYLMTLVFELQNTYGIARAAKKKYRYEARRALNTQSLVPLMPLVGGDGHRA